MTASVEYHTYLKKNMEEHNDKLLPVKLPYGLDNSLPCYVKGIDSTNRKRLWRQLARLCSFCSGSGSGGIDKTGLFLETVVGLEKQWRPCLLDCIPIPYNLREKAPMYFRKATEEAEEEWGQHDMKKVIPTSGNLQHVIPENFSYFHVEFGFGKGFVNVIDNDSNFNSGFVLNVVRCLLRLPEEEEGMHRRRRHEPLEKQKQTVAIFAQQWEQFDWTRDLD